MKLEIGPGRRKIDKNWTTMDCRPRAEVDIVHDLEDLPLPLEDESCDYIYLCHVLEHVPWFKVDDVLTELARILAPGGCLEIHVPDAEKLCQAYLGLCESKDNWWKFNPEKDRTKWFSGRMYAYGDSKGDPNWHKSAHCMRSLAKSLNGLGLRGIRRCDQPLGRDDHGWINLGVRAWKQTD